MNCLKGFLSLDVVELIILTEPAYYIYALIIFGFRNATDGQNGFFYFTGESGFGYKF